MYIVHNIYCLSAPNKNGVWALSQELELSGAHTPRSSTASGLYCISPDLNLELENVDNLYLHITLHYCAHEQKAHGLQLIGVVNKNTVFVTLVDLADLFEA